MHYFTVFARAKQDLSLLLLQDLDWLNLLSLDLLILYNELVMLSFPSFPFIVLLLQDFWFKFGILFKFFFKKTNHFLTKPSTLFSSSVSLSSCPLRFHVSPSSSIAFFSSFLISDCLFWVSASALRSLSSNLSVGLQEVASFDFSSFFWLVPFHEGSKMIPKTSRSYCKFSAVV